MNYEFRQRYVFVEQLGRGGMGAVFRAYDRHSPANPWVAIKVAQLRGGTERRELLKEVFAREARAASMFAENKAYFVGLRGVDYNDPAYIALEYVPWPTLKAFRQRAGTLTPVHVAKIGIKILQGLRCMERRRMVHRDLKPENLFVHRLPDGESFEVKIADLGIWYDAGEPDTLLDVPNGLRHIGTPAYMSPEHVRGEMVTTASDLHMLGSVLWELATGRVPFPVHNGQGPEKGMADRLESLRTVPARPPSVPVELYEILATALAFDPQKRSFSDEQATSPNEFYLSRDMEKALQKFADEYPRKRMRDLEEAFRRLDTIAGRLTDLDARLIRFEDLAARKDALRNRLRALRNESTEPDVLGGGVRSLGDQVEAFVAEANAILSADTHRAEEASESARKNAERAAEAEKKVAELRCECDALRKERDSLRDNGAALRKDGEELRERNSRLRQENQEINRRRFMLPVVAAMAAGILLGFLIALRARRPEPAQAIAASESTHALMAPTVKPNPAPTPQPPDTATAPPAEPSASTTAAPADAPSATAVLTNAPAPVQPSYVPPKAKPLLATGAECTLHKQCASNFCENSRCQ